MKTPIIIATALLFIAAGFVMYATGLNVNQPVSDEQLATTTPQAIYINATTDDIVVDFPAPESILDQSFEITGQARGTWYFEGDFPIDVISENGTTLVSLPGSADGEWMTTEFVPFSALIEVGDYIGPATIVLRRDNPSGLPEYDASISIPIIIEAPAVDTDVPSDSIDIEQGRDRDID